MKSKQCQMHNVSRKKKWTKTMLQIVSRNGWKMHGILLQDLYA